MKIAFISYEYAGTATSGGIGTYTRNAARMMAQRGHLVEVFTAGEPAHCVVPGNNLGVHFIRSTREQFSQAVAGCFASRHEELDFDVLEGPEYKTDAAEILRAFPNLPVVVKLHGPSFTIFESNSHYVSLLAKARFFAGGIRRGRMPQNPWRYDPACDPERAHAIAADELTANSKTVADRVARVWKWPQSRIVPIPLVFYPPPALLQISPQSDTRTVLFLGRLEVRKGVIELARAIPLVLRKRPDTRFRFVGRSLPHPQTGLSLVVHLKDILGKYSAAVEFTGGVPYDEIPLLFDRCDICVFPSHWEASGFVCMEAMAAARGVIGSSSGGMKEIIEDGRTGLLVPPSNPSAIAEAILELVMAPDRRMQMGTAAREHVISAYSPDVIAPLQEASYLRAIEHARRRKKFTNDMPLRVAAK